MAAFKSPKRIRLSTPRDVRRELSRLYGGLLRDEIAVDKAKAGGFLLRTMLESMRLDELESRLTKLEETLAS